MIAQLINLIQIIINKHHNDSCIFPFNYYYYSYCDYHHDGNSHQLKTTTAPFLFRYTFVVVYVGTWPCKRRNITIHRQTSGL